MTNAMEEDKGREEEQEIQGIYCDETKDNKARALVPDSNGLLQPKMITKKRVSATVGPEGSYQLVYLCHFTLQESFTS